MAGELDQFLDPVGEQPTAKPPPVGQVYLNAVRQAGLGDEWAPWMARTHQIENGGRWTGANSSSGAMGGFQFIPSTWKATARPGEDPYNPQDNANAAARYLKQNIAHYTSAVGTAPQPWEMYMMHQQGAGGYTKLLANLDTRAGDLVGDAAIRQNGGDPNAPARDFLTHWQNKFNNTPMARGAGADLNLPLTLGGRKLVPGPVAAGGALDEGEEFGPLDQFLPPVTLPKIPENIGAEVKKTQPDAAQPDVIGGPSGYPSWAPQTWPARALQAMTLRGPEAQIPPWAGPAASFASDATGGLGPELGAAGGATELAARGLAQGQPAGSFRQNYGSKLAEGQVAQAEANAEAPGTNAAARFGGQLLPQIAATAIGIKGLQALGQGIPALAGATNLLTGAPGTSALPSLARGAIAGGVQGGLGAAGLEAPRALGNALAPGSVEANPEALGNIERGAGIGALVGGVTQPVLEHFFPGLNATANPDVARAIDAHLQDARTQGQAAAAAARARGASFSDSIKIGKQVEQQSAVQIPAASIIANPHTAQAVSEVAGQTDIAGAQSFARQLGRTFGGDQEMDALGTRGLTPEVFDTAEKRVRGTLQNFVSQSGPIPLDQTFRVNTGKILRDVQEAAPSVTQEVQDLVNVVKNTRKGGISTGTLTPEAFQNITNSASDIYSAMSKPGVAPYAQRLMDELYGAVERANPDIAAEFAQARRQYGNLKAVQSMVKGNPAAQTGIISPPSIAGQLAKSGREDLEPLGRLGRFVPPVGKEGGGRLVKPTMLFGTRGVAAAAGGGGAIGASLAEAAPAITGTLSANPLLLAPVGAGIGAGAAARHIYGGYVGSPAYMQDVLRNTLRPGAPSGFINPFVPAGTGLFQRQPEFGGT